MEFGTVDDFTGEADREKDPDAADMGRLSGGFWVIGVEDLARRAGVVGLEAAEALSGTA
jgi:hypothetical protein